MTAFHLTRIFAVGLVCTGIALPISGQETASPASRKANTASKPPAPKGLDLNTADVTALAAVPVIGPEAARAIVAARPFTSIDDLDRVKGITTAQLEQIRSVVTVDPASTRFPTPPSTPAAAPSKQPGDASRKVDLNTADLKSLEALSGVSPETARAIVAARPFDNVDGLSRVKGITAEQLEQIRAQVIVKPPKLPAP